MSNKKSFGIWMDAHHATIVRKEEGQRQFSVVAHVKGEASHGNSNENTGNNHEQTLTGQFFKQITAHMPNVDVLHITGTGQVQEQFARYLADTPQYKGVQTTGSTANKMTDEALLEYFADKLT